MIATDNKADRYLKLSDALMNGECAQKRKEWFPIAEVMAPELLDAAEHRENARSRQYERGCAVAVECADKLAGACLSYITPMGHRWFRFDSWEREAAGLSKAEKEEMELWFVKISDIVEEAVVRSNFYGELLAAYYDFVVTGTAVVFGGYDEDEFCLDFRHIPAGTYGLDRDAKGRVSTLVREIKMTAHQLKQMFPDAEFSARINSAWDDMTQRYTKTFNVVHVVAPREQYARENLNKYDKTSYPFLSLYIDKESKQIIEEDGFLEFPYLVMRYSRAGNQVYGTSPFVRARDIIDDIRELESVALLDAKKKVAPPVLVPAEMAGQVSLEPGGQTIVPPQYTNSQLPREWGVGGDVRELVAYMERLEGTLKKVTQVSMLEIISDVPREMTATEVIARQKERVMSYARTFTQIKSDLTPFILRILNNCIHLGLVDLWQSDVPAFIYTESDDDRELNTPKVLYIGRMAQTMEQAQMQNVDSCVTRLSELAHINQEPDLLMILDMQKVARGQAIAQGIPHEYLRSSREIDKLKKQLQASQDMRANADMALKEAQAQEHSAKAAALMQQMNE